MEYIVIIITSIIAIIALKIGFNIHIKDIKKIIEIGYDKELNKIADKFPENKEICEKILEKLDNRNVTIEETQDSKTSLYIALTNKIIIANIKDTFTRIQTIAHECLHSVQSRRILMFNFIFSNIFLLYFIAAIFLILFNVGNNLMLYIEIYTILAIIYCAVRNYLETEAMSKAIFVAKEYMEDYAKENKEIAQDDIDTLTNNFDILNKIGIPMTNFSLVVGTIVKMIILAVLALI
mgnify:CR=1 FL=1